SSSLPSHPSVLFFFFFQAEDGIRDATVTGVQTCLFRSSRARLPRVPHAWTFTNGAPAAILNAVNDALVPFGAMLTEQPMTPQREIGRASCRERVQLAVGGAPWKGTERDDSVGT